MSRILDGFPKDFLWGGAVTANQLEGAYTVGGKGLCVADINEFRDDIDIIKKYNSEVTSTYMKDAMNAGSNNGRVFPRHRGIDLYHTYKEDLRLLAELGLKTFRTSTNWARIFPNGDDGTPNEEGLKFYGALFDEVLKHNMVPVITVSHYEMPLYLTLKYKGWYSRETISFFESYCKVIFDRHHDKVKHWILVNQISLTSYESINHLGIAEDMVDDLGSAKYQAVHNEMIACARATRCAHATHPDLQIGMMLCGGHDYTTTSKPEDQLAALQYNQMKCFYSDVLLRGVYPGYTLRFFEDHDIHVEFGEQDEEDLKNTCDFFSFSHYYTRTVTKESFENGNDFIRNKELPANEWGWTYDPIGLRVLLNTFWDHYQKPIYITENGSGFYDKLENDHIHDPYRADSYRNHFEQIKETIRDGVDVRGYYAWGPIDIISCSSSEMSKRYRFIHIDYDDYGKGSGERIKKDSFAWHKKVIETNDEELD